MTHPEQETIFLAAASVCASLAAVSDVRSRRIPNLITGPALLAGLLLHLGLGGWRGLLTSLAAALVCGGIFLVFYLAGGMGAGDVKLIAATAALAGWTHVPYLLVLTSLAGGVMAVGWALYRGQLRQVIVNTAAIAAHHGRQGLTPHPELNVENTSTLRIPYGLAIAIGSLLTLYLQGQQT